jgi:hypothetical protein
MCDYFDSRETVGTLSHTRSRIEGMTTITPCKMLSDSMVQKEIKKNELFSLFLSKTPLLRAITISGVDD